VASFRPGGLPAGDYTLVVTVVDPASHRRQSSSIPFVVAAGGSNRAALGPASAPGQRRQR
ncbi:MAG TPA: hypothetical protein VOA87_15565, partial [Thermoanaerobaculia bacterium]|nr:hypothetical protein [Thermoanaerobaculia bacterium]